MMSKHTHSKSPTPLKNGIHEAYTRRGGGGGAWLWELDIEDFFPSLDRDGALEALPEVHHLVSEAQGKRKVNSELHFSICKAM